MTWNGSIAVVGGRVLGKLVDESGWVLDVDGVPDGANRLNLVAQLARRGAEAADPATHRQHEALIAPGATLAGELVRKQLGLGVHFTWNGSLAGPWTMSLKLSVPRWISGPIALRGEPVG